MKKSEIEKKVISMIAEIFEVDEDELSGKTNLVKDLGAESLDLVDLILALEEEFGAVVADEDMASIQTISDIVNYIAAHS